MFAVPVRGSKIDTATRLPSGDSRGAKYGRTSWGEPRDSPARSNQTSSAPATAEPVWVLHHAAVGDREDATAEDWVVLQLFGDRERLACEAPAAQIERLSDQHALPHEQQMAGSVRDVGARVKKETILLAVEGSEEDRVALALGAGFGGEIEETPAVGQEEWPPMRRCPCGPDQTSLTITGLPPSQRRPGRPACTDPQKSSCCPGSRILRALLLRHRTQ